MAGSFSTLLDLISPRPSTVGSDVLFMICESGSADARRVLVLVVLEDSLRATTNGR